MSSVDCILKKTSASLNWRPIESYSETLASWSEFTEKKLQMKWPNSSPCEEITFESNPLTVHVIRLDSNKFRMSSWIPVDLIWIKTGVLSSITAFGLIYSIAISLGLIVRMLVFVVATTLPVYLWICSTQTWCYPVIGILISWHVISVSESIVPRNPYWVVEVRHSIYPVNWYVFNLGGPASKCNLSVNTSFNILNFGSTLLTVYAGKPSWIRT